MPIDMMKLPWGLHVVTRPKLGGLVTHVGLVDVGNQLRLGARPGAGPVVVHHPPNGLVAVYAADSGVWEAAFAVSNVAGVRERVSRAFEDRTYNLFGANCEHFISFALSGERKSPQLQAALTIAAIAIGAALIFGGGGAAPRRA
jgi:hypothetical protein